MGAWRASRVGLLLAATVAFTAAGAASVSVAPEAHAQSKSDEAKARYLKGVELHDEGDYQAALIEFRRSYELVPNFNVLYNIGQEYFQLADYANALRTFQQYMDEGGRRIPPNRKEAVEKDIEKLKSRVATVVVKVNVQGAELRVDDLLVAAPITGPVLVSAGKRRIEVSKQGYRTLRRTEDFAGQETRELKFDLQPEAIVTDGGANKPPVIIIGDNQVGAKSDPGPPVAPIVMWSVTGALAIGTGVFGGIALANESSLDELKRTPGTPESELDDAATKSRNMAIAADVFLGATAIAAGLSIYFTIDAALTPEKKDERPQGPPPAPQPATKVGFGPGTIALERTF